MTRNVSQRNGDAAILKLFPIEIIAPRLVGRVVPPGNLVSLDLWPNLRQERLLNGTGNGEIVLHLLERAFGLRLAKSSLEIVPNYPSNQGGHKPGQADHNGKE